MRVRVDEQASKNADAALRRYRKVYLRGYYEALKLGSGLLKSFVMHPKYRILEED
jgi:hypothetical protein